MFGILCRSRGSNEPPNATSRDFSLGPPRQGPGMVMAVTFHWQRSQVGHEKWWEILHRKYEDTHANGGSFYRFLHCKGQVLLCWLLLLFFFWGGGTPKLFAILYREGNMSEILTWWTGLLPGFRAFCRLLRNGSTWPVRVELWIKQTTHFTAPHCMTAKGDKSK